MIQLIADSGSSKTQWVLIKDSELLIDTCTRGINPFFQNETSIAEEIKTGLIPIIGEIIPEEIIFYGAGCAFPEKKTIVSEAIKRHFNKAKIIIESDLLAAARGLLQHNEGIACILGTGSNSCLYDGCEIIQNISPLGFILGDEGSGAVLGKKLIADILKNQLPEDLRTSFFERYPISVATILDRVYKQAFPNRFLASFAPFLAEHINHPNIHQIVLESFKSFFIRNVLQYNKPQLPISFTGSVAVHFKTVLTETASMFNLHIDKTEQSPMSGLINYHGRP